MLAFTGALVREITVHNTTRVTSSSGSELNLIAITSIWTVIESLPELWLVYVCVAWNHKRSLAQGCLLSKTQETKTSATRVATMSLFDGVQADSRERWHLFCLQMCSCFSQNPALFVWWRVLIWSRPEFARHENCHLIEQWTGISFKRWFTCILLYMYGRSPLFASNCEAFTRSSSLLPLATRW